MIKFVSFYFGIFLNAAAGVYLYLLRPEHDFWYWLLILGIAIWAILSVFSFGFLSLAWAAIMKSDRSAATPEMLEYMKTVYTTTVESLKQYSKFRFYASFVSSIVLMAGIAQQGLVFVLALEVLGSAIGYGFVSWAMANNHLMHQKVYGTEK